MSEAADVGATTLCSMFGTSQASVGSLASTQTCCRVTEEQKLLFSAVRGVGQFVALGV